jgi:hypothetical protein
MGFNGAGTPRYPGSNGRLVRLAQKLLDRLLFVAYCDDMGQRLAYPAKLLQDLLIQESNLRFFDADDDSVWRALQRLFRSMNEGRPFGGKSIPTFNGGLFAQDAALDALHIPNRIFCQPQQGANQANIETHKLTALYLVATYNYAADLGGSTERSLGLYKLGRIFEQSITELEILEAEADEQPSLNKLSGRKTDGVYYTPEWVVELIVSHTLEPAFTDLRRGAGWDEASEAPPSSETLDAYMRALTEFTICDPACGSGAFLVTALRHLAGEWRRIRAVRAQLGSVADASPETEADLIARLLRENIHGVDINPASVEISQLALWLHTASGDRTLAALDGTIRCGNSLVTDAFYKGREDDLLSTERRERINTFDWRDAFPHVQARGGFDAVVGNPPYVKLQNFRAVFPEIADYLARGTPGLPPPFKSTRTGNFDLYLPFIEQGLAMLKPTGRMGYIAPSLWTINKYGAALRHLIAQKRQLEGWLDFGSFQVFDEATTYTALQFFSKRAAPAIRVARAPRGVVAPGALRADGPRLGWGEQDFGDRWLMLTGPERALLDRLRRDCRVLGDKRVTSHIFQGLIPTPSAGDSRMGFPDAARV